jgi:hypothetical protein
VFGLGKFTFTSGILNGLSRTVQICDLTTGAAVMYGPFPSAPNFGDSFIMRMGCNKSFTDSNGCPKFSNQLRFRGFPFVPQPETAI